MRILPVLDIKSGQVVRGIAGRRHEYAPIRSELTASAKIVDVALAFRAHLGLTELYLADLDAIDSAPANTAAYAVLKAFDFRLWVDAGLRSVEMAVPLTDCGVDKIIYGLETLTGPSELARSCDALGSRLVFSLDLKNGEPFGDRQAWGSADVWSIVEQAIAAGVAQMIVLDLARVGVGGGTGTEALCSRIIRTYSAVEVIAGGGVRGVEDLRRLQGCGVHGVLVASALHDGSLRREHLDEFTA
jgi:phosphoribosylformimino-5-aminoimidazole carboxamide ribotide isomerase